MNDEPSGEHRSNSAGDDSPLVRPWLLFLTLPVLLAVVVVLSWRDDGGASSSDRSVLDRTFDGPAYGQDATVDDLLAAAAELTARLRDEFPASAMAFSIAARREYLLSSTEAATRLWTESLQLDPAFAEAFFGLGLIALDRDEYESAVEMFRDVRRLAPDDPRAPVLLADALLNAGRTDEAILVLEQHLQNQHASAEALAKLGDAYLQADQLEAAQRSLETAVQVAPGLKDAVYNLARIYAQTGETVRAEAFMSRFQELDSHDRTQNMEDAKAFRDRGFASHVAAQVHADAARLYRQAGKPGMAEEMLLRAVALEPSNAEYVSRLLAFYEQEGRPRAGLDVARRLVELDPNNADFHVNVAVLAAELDRTEEAILAVEQAMRIDPDNPRCRAADTLLKSTR